VLWRGQVPFFLGRFAKAASPNPSLKRPPSGGRFALGLSFDTRIGFATVLPEGSFN
jgi:hypothetical protein